MSVTLTNIRGSAPQSNGAKMLISAHGLWGTIGGGNLEYQAINRARTILEAESRHSSSTYLESVSLGVSSGQCCGGTATLVYQRYQSQDLQLLRHLASVYADKPYLITPLHQDAMVNPQLLDQNELLRLQLEGDNAASRLDTFIKVSEQAALLVQRSGDEWLLEKISTSLIPVLIFGAGHVGKAVAKALAPLPFAVSVIDSREDLQEKPLGDNIQFCFGVDPLVQLEQAAVGAWVLVMTHDHALDFAIVYAALKRNDFEYLGLIGSKTKLQRFKHRLRELGVAQTAIERMNSPIGIAGINSKQPPIIAASVAAQLLFLREKVWLSRANRHRLGDV